MDLASVIGLVIITFSLLATILNSFFFPWSPQYLKGIIDPASVVCVLGGMAGATLVTFSMANMSNFGKIFGQLLKPQMESEQSIEMMKKLMEIGLEARRGGILSVEPLVAQLDDPFLQKSLQLAVDGRDADDIRSTLEGELTFMSGRHETGASMFDTMNKYCPAFGMIGTLLGLIAMLGNMGGAGMDISALTGGMATALITTLYGSGPATVRDVAMAFVRTLGRLAAGRHELWHHTAQRLKKYDKYRQSLSENRSHCLS